MWLQVCLASICHAAGVGTHCTCILHGAGHTINSTEGRWSTVTALLPDSNVVALCQPPLQHCMQILLGITCMMVTAPKGPCWVDGIGMPQPYIHAGTLLMF